MFEELPDEEKTEELPIPEEKPDDSGKPIIEKGEDGLPVNEDDAIDEDYF